MKNSSTLILPQSKNAFWFKEVKNKIHFILYTVVINMRERAIEITLEKCTTNFLSLHAAHKYEISLSCTTV
jgi:hypothetical protein